MTPPPRLLGRSLRLLAFADKHNLCVHADALWQRISPNHWNQVFPKVTTSSESQALVDVVNLDDATIVRDRLSLARGTSRHVLDALKRQ